MTVYIALGSPPNYEVSPEGLVLTPCILYHLTSTKNLKSIRRYGLRPGTFLTWTKEDADGYWYYSKEPGMGIIMEKRVVIISVKVDPGRVWDDGSCHEDDWDLADSWDGFMTARWIMPSKIEVITKLII